MKHIIDATNLLCPMPVIKTQNKVKSLMAGDELEVICTDPGALQDIPAWCRIFGHEVLATRQEETKYIVHIKVGN